MPWSNLFLCCQPAINAGFSLSDITDVIQAIASVINLGLIIFLFDQERKRHDDVSKYELVKDNYILPKLKLVNKFYDDFSNKAKKLQKENLTQPDLDAINAELKSVSRAFQNDVIADLLPVVPNLHKKCKDNIDDLTDSITVDIFDLTNVNLNDEQNYNRIIAKTIIDSKTDFLQCVFKASNYR